MTWNVLLTPVVAPSRGAHAHRIEEAAHRCGHEWAQVERCGLLGPSQIFLLPIFRQYSNKFIALKPVRVCYSNKYVDNKAVSAIAIDNRQNAFDIYVLPV